MYSAQDDDLRSEGGHLIKTDKGLLEKFSEMSTAVGVMKRKQDTQAETAEIIEKAKLAD